MHVLFFQLIARRISSIKVVGDLRIKFSEQNAIHLELPTGKVGHGWQLVPFAKPLQASDIIICRKINICMHNDIMPLIILMC